MALRDLTVIPLLEVFEDGELLEWCTRFDNSPSVFPRWPASARLTLVAVVDHFPKPLCGYALRTDAAATQFYHQCRDTCVALYFTIPVREVESVLAELAEKGNHE